MKSYSVFFLVLIATAGASFAQMGAPRVSVRTFLETDGAHPGGVLRTAIEVRLPRGYHVNSDEPLDEYLIPTRLELEVPEGVSVRQTVYPEAIELRTSFSNKPLSVYEDRFLIGATLAVGKNVEPGERVITGKLQYQACDDKACYRPASKKIELTLTVVPEGRDLMPANAEIFETIAFDTEGRR